MPNYLGHTAPYYVEVSGGMGRALSKGGFRSLKTARNYVTKLYHRGLVFGRSVEIRDDNGTKVFSHDYADHMGSGPKVNHGRRRNVSRARKAEVTKTYRGDKAMEAGVKRLEKQYQNVTTVRTSGTWHAPIYTVYAKEPRQANRGQWIKVKAVRVTNSGVVQVRR